MSTGEPHKVWTTKRSINCLCLRATVDWILLEACSREGFSVLWVCIAKYSNFRAGKGLRDLCD